MSPRVVRNKFHRSAIAWPADALTEIPYAPVYVAADDVRPWRREMVLTPCADELEAKRVRVRMVAAGGWARVRVLHRKPLQRRGWLLTIVQLEEWLMGT